MTMPLFLRVIVFLNLASILLPVAMQYLAASSLLIWLIVNKTLFKRKPPIYFLYEADQNSFHKLYKLLWFLFGSIFLAATISSLLSSYPVSIGKVLSEAWHLSAKQSILPISLICGMLLLKQRYGKLPDLAFAIATYVTFYTIYCIAQRYFGLDWVRGFSSVLPDNRFAYGVYRISGLMGHPLSLAYNLVFAAILFGYFGFCAFKDGQKSKAFWWYYCTGLVLLILALSGSRWPLLVAIAVTSFLFVGQLFKRWKIILLAASLLGAGIYFEGSVVNRFSEIFEDGQIKTDKIPRLVFWKIHSKMFVDDPVWGVGYSARNLGAVDYYNKNGYNNIERKYSAHNQYLQVLADGGLVGFVVIFGFWVWLLILFNLVTDAAVKKVLYMILMVVGLSCLMKNVLRDTEFLFGLWLLIAFSYTSLPLKNNMRT